MEEKKVKIKCPICENEIEVSIEGVMVGDIMECPICGGNFEVVSVDPFKVEPITTWK